MQLTRSQPIRFHRADGSIVLARPATRGQMREIFEIEREVGNSVTAEARGRMVSIFLRDAAWLQPDGESLAGETADLLDDLTAEEEIDIVNAFCAQHNGRPVA
jgi:hypothetical protein